MDAKRRTRQRREGEANRPRRAKTGQCKLRKLSWTEFVRLADQAVVAIAGADMINRAEPRACGYSRRSRRLDKKRPETGERQLRRQTKPRKVSEGRRRTRLTSSAALRRNTNDSRMRRCPNVRNAAFRWQRWHFERPCRLKAAFRGACPDVPCILRPTTVNELNIAKRAGSANKAVVSNLSRSIHGRIF